jgi:hypothetical protein
VAANVYLKQISISFMWQKLSTTSLVLNVTIAADPRNTASVNVRYNNGAGVEWAPGTRIELVGVDLSKFEASGTGGDKLLVVGTSR